MPRGLSHGRVRRVHTDMCGAEPGARRGSMETGSACTAPVKEMDLLSIRVLLSGVRFGEHRADRVEAALSNSSLVLCRRIMCHHSLVEQTRRKWTCRKPQLGVATLKAEHGRLIDVDEHFSCMCFARRTVQATFGTWCQERVVLKR